VTDQAKVIRWEEPPPSRRRNESKAPWSRFNAVADELRAKPGRWAVIAELPGRSRTALATHVRVGAIACFTPAGDFEAASRQTPGLTTVYARYLGDGGRP
jgi:hypothetical protein